MSTFEDGPAAGETLMLRRAPIFLRVVVGVNGEVDALDQLDDDPEQHEVVQVYEQIEGTRAHVCIRQRGRSGCYETARYRWRPDVAGESLRSRDSWREWANAEGARREAAA